MHRRPRARRSVVAVALITALALLGACTTPTTDAVVGSLTLRDLSLVLRDDGRIAATFEVRNESSVDRAVTIRWPVIESLRERSVPVVANGTTIVTLTDDVVLDDLVAAAGEEVEVTVTEGYFFREESDVETLILVVRDEGTER